MKAFPIPVVALGPGTQSEDENLDYLPMPKDMDTYRAPVLPEPEEIAGRAAALDQRRAASQGPRRQLRRRPPDGAGFGSGERAAL